jgi:hypothetical protein
MKYTCSAKFLRGMCVVSIMLSNVFRSYIPSPKLLKLVPIKFGIGDQHRTYLDLIFRGKGEVVPALKLCTTLAPRILYLGISWRWMVSFMPRPLFPQRKSPWYPLDRRLSGRQSRCGRCSEEKNSQLMRSLEPLIIQPVGQRCITELSRLHGCNI